MHIVDQEPVCLPVCLSICLSVEAVLCWIVGIREEDPAVSTKMPRFYPGMAVWRHSVTTHKCRSSALNLRPRLFKFAFFANMASDRSSASLYFVRL